MEQELVRGSAPDKVRGAFGQRSRWCKGEACPSMRQLAASDLAATWPPSHADFADRVEQLVGTPSHMSGRCSQHLFCWAIGSALATREGVTH